MWLRDSRCQTTKHDLRGTCTALADTVDGFAAWARTESIQFEIWCPVLEPSHDHGGLLTTVLVDLENIHSDALSEFLRRNRALHRCERAVVGAGQLISGN